MIKIDDRIAAFIRYLISGGSTYLLYIGCLYVSIDILQMQSALAFVASFTIANIYNYLAHYFFTFSSNEHHKDALKKFLFVISVGTALGYAFNHIVTIFAPEHMLIANAFYGAVWPLASFFLLKKIVFLQN